MERKLKNYDDTTKYTLVKNYNYLNENDIVKSCKYCNEVLKFNTNEYDNGCHIDKCKQDIGYAQRLIEKIQNNDDVKVNKSLLIDILTEAVDKGTITHAFARKTDKLLNLNIFC